MKNDDKVIAKISAEEKADIMALADGLDLTMGQVVRESLQRIKPILTQRLAEKEQAIALPE